jgi:dinuclear metal center YbgI/SA1388 family protein
MIPLQAVCEYLGHFAPSRLAEEWDNVGLLVGDLHDSIQRVMTCLTVTPDSAGEAVAQGADLIITHHPLPFRPLKRLTTNSTPERLLLQIARAGIAVYSPHTAFDSAATGINQQLAAGLGLTNVAPLVAKDEVPSLGAGRFGELPQAVSLPELAAQLKAFLKLSGLHVVGDAGQPRRRVAVACGAAGEFLEPARRAGCDTLVTGETTFHTCLEAEAQGIALLLPGHFASERFAVETLAATLAAQFPELNVWASRDERDPLRWC